MPEPPKELETSTGTVTNQTAEPIVLEQPIEHLDTPTIQPTSLKSGETITLPTETLNQNTLTAEKRELGDDYLYNLGLLNLLDKNEIISSYGIKEIVVILLKIFGVDGKRFSTEEIAKFLNIDELEIIEIVRNVLNSYKEQFNKSIDDVMENLLVDLDDLLLTRIISDKNFIQIMSMLNAKEIIVVALKAGYVNGKHYTLEELAEFLGVSILDVIGIIKGVLLTYKQFVNEHVNSALMITAKRARFLTTTE